MRLRIYKQSFPNIQNMGMNLRYDLFLDDRSVMCCTFAYENDSDPDMVNERNRRAINKLITELKRNPRKYLNLEHYAHIPYRYRNPLVDVEIKPETIKEWYIEEKLKRINDDFE